MYIYSRISEPSTVCKHPRSRPKPPMGRHGLPRMAMALGFAVFIAWLCEPHLHRTFSGRIPRSPKWGPLGGV